MSKNFTGDLDAFATGIEQLIGDIPMLCREKVDIATEKATREGVKTVKSYAAKGGAHDWSEEYVEGFKARITRDATTEGEIGNKNKPGLVHLLEKGHVTLNGRRTRAFPHMAPAFTVIQQDFIDKVEKAVGEALR